MYSVRKSNEMGFSLIELLFVLGILGVVMFASSSSVLSSMKATKNNSLNQEIDDSIYYTKQIIKDQTARQIYLVRRLIALL